MELTLLKEVRPAVEHARGWRIVTMPAIATLTMNPAIDVSATVDRVEPVRKLRCGSERRDPGGGGINVARVLRRFGAEVVAVYPVGGFVGQSLQQLVAQEGVRSVSIPIAGETREDFTVSERASGRQYRFVLPGPRLSEQECAACLAAFAALGEDFDFICASGSLPPGAPSDFYAQISGIAARWKVKLVLDTSGAALKSALEAGAYLVKPSVGELRELTGSPLEDIASMVRACRGLIARGAVDLVALTLGADGALLVGARDAWRAPALPIKPISTVGTGDSFLGAMVWALSSGCALREAFRYGVAGGSAALLVPGTELCQPQDVRELLSRVVIEDLAADGSSRA